MLGRTHMAIGALAAIGASTWLLGAPWIPVQHGLLDPTALVREAEVVGAMMLGSVLPDLDESHALLARKVETGARLAMLLFVGWLVVSHHVVSALSFGTLALVALALFVPADLARKLALGGLSLLALYAGATGSLPIVGAVALAIWAFGAALTPHRTFTHSLPGLVVLAVGLLDSVPGAVHSLSMAILLGYGLHLAADIPSGGVPLAWPYPKRIGMHAVKTGGAVDHLIGGVATLLFLALFIFPA
ncbi:MAG: metal-dependent hydrolase [Bacilli bacterium]